jgi:hypothetical protein
MAVTSGRNKVFKLIARGTELDLFQDETIYLSNNVTGLFDLGKLPSDFTRQITLPGTRKNNNFFQHVYDISIDEPFLFKTNTKVIAQFDFDGFYVSQGYMQLEKVNLKENKYIESYEVSVYGLLSSFKKDLQNLTLNELSSLDKYNHIFSGGNILHSWSGSAYNGSSHFGNQIFTSSVDGHNLGGEIVYCLTDSGKQIAYQAVLPDNLLGIDNTEKSPFGGTIAGDGGLYAQDFKPAIRLDAVVDAIFDEVGYTYESTFLSESRFDNTYILCDRGLKYPIIEGVDLETAGQIEIGPISGSDVPVTISNASSVTQSAHIPMRNVYKDPSFSIQNSGDYSPNFQGARVQGSPARCELTLNLQISGSNTNSYPELSFITRDAGTGDTELIRSLDSMNRRIRQAFVNSGGEVDLTLTEEIDLGSLTSGSLGSSSSTINFGLLTQVYGGSTVNVTVGPGGNEETRLKIISLLQVGDLLPISIANNMPFGTSGITLLDFMSSIQKKFNLQIYPSKTKPRHFIIETFNNWYKQGVTKNFDNFIDLNQRLSVIPANNLGMREVEFGDTLDVDFLAQNFNKENNREYGKSYFRDTQNFFSEGKLEVQSGFSSSPLRFVGGSGITGSQGSPLTLFLGAIGTTTLAACGQAASTYYHNGSNPDPVNGDTIYYDQAGTQPVVTYQYLADDFGGLLELNPGTGVVTDDAFGTCSGGGGPTS